MIFLQLHNEENTRRYEGCNQIFAKMKKVIRGRLKVVIISVKHTLPALK